ncbi:MAG TPA: metal ABC transporter permease, partial [Alphaproteobacteria bacterium]|nr:metal ABC transporter permease [Alphaproteobacteria bacterium]
MPEFMLRALVGGVAVALVAGPLGCFVVWRRMAYFGDALAHSALLGIALGVVLHISPLLGVVGVAAATALMLVLAQRQSLVPIDSVLGMLAHTTLALGLIAIALVRGPSLDLFGFLFGDILALAWDHFPWIIGGGVLALGVLAAIWRPLLNMTVHEELATVDGVRTGLVRIAYLLLIALTVAIALKIVGVLLITSLLIIPPAAARRFARTPEQMAALAAGAGALSVAGGLAGSYAWDLPAGPSVVAAAAALFVAVTLVVAPLIG